MLGFFLWLLFDGIESSVETKTKSERPKLKCEHGKIQFNCYGCEINSRYKSDKEYA